MNAKEEAQDMAAQADRLAPAEEVASTSQQPSEGPTAKGEPTKGETTTRAEYTEDEVRAIAEHVLAEVAGGRSLKGVLDKDDGMPSRKTWYRWLFDVEGLKDKYEIALTDRADALFDEITDIADDGSNDWMESHKPDDPGYELNGEHIQRSKLRVDARKWAASKLRPKKYGDHVDVTSGGEKLGFDVSSEQAAQLIRARADRSDTP